MGKRERVDKLLCDRGLVGSREEGRGKILAGDVLVNDRPVTKAGTLVDENAAIRLKTKASPYVSRGGTKLEKALQEFHISPNGKVALDVGASTGGFTAGCLPPGAIGSIPFTVVSGRLVWKLAKIREGSFYRKPNIANFAFGILRTPPNLPTSR